MRHQRTIVILGSNGVGKSSLIRQYCEDMYTASYLPTIQNAYRKEAYWDGQPIDLVIRDTAGQSEVSEFQLQFGAGAHGYIIMYSVAKKKTLEDAKFIHDNLLTNLMGTAADIPVVLVGNKCDLEAERRVSIPEGRAVANAWKCPFVETSAKNNEHVDEVFSLLLAKIYKGEYTPPKRPGMCSCRCRADQMTHAQQTRVVNIYLATLFVVMLCSLFTLLSAIGYAGQDTDRDKMPAYVLGGVGVLGLAVSSAGAYGSIKLRAGIVQVSAVCMVLVTAVHVAALGLSVTDTVFRRWMSSTAAVVVLAASVIDVVAQLVAASLSCTVFSIAAQTFDLSYSYAVFDREPTTRNRRASEVVSSSVGHMERGLSDRGGPRLGARRLSWSGEHTRER